MQYFDNDIIACSNLKRERDMDGEITLALINNEGRIDLETDRPLIARRTALIIVDMQYLDASRDVGFGRQMADNGQAAAVNERFNRIENMVVPRTQELLGFFRSHGLHVIYLTLGSLTEDFSDVPHHMKRMLRELNGRVGTRESEILDELAPEPGEAIINKTTVGAFASTNLDSHLRYRGIESVLFTGVGTSNCVASTAREAADRGDSVILVEDACTETNADDHERTLLQFRRLFGRTAMTAQVLLELGRSVDGISGIA